MQELKIYQSLWAMELRNPNLAERTRAEAFQMVADAGYHGICIDPSVSEIEEMRSLLPLYEKHDLECMINAFPFSEDDMLPIFDFAREANATLVNIIGGVTPLKPADSVPVVRRWMKEAKDAEMTVLFETHRDSLLNDLYYTLQVMDLVPDMRMCADLSHFVIDREMRSPVPARDEEYIQRILNRSDCFQGRVANREQIQVQIDFPQHQQWVEIFKGWWKYGMQSWRERNSDNETLHFLCELGPPPYAMTDGRQQELSDRWQEALTIRGWIEEIWDNLEPDVATPDDSPSGKIA